MPILTELREILEIQKLYAYLYDLKATGHYMQKDAAKNKKFLKLLREREEDLQQRYTSLIEGLEKWHSKGE